MPQVEIDEQELLRLRRLGETVGAMYKSPTAKRKILEALKDVSPNDPAVKELEQPDPVSDRFTALEKQNADLRKQMEDDRAEREKNEKLADLKAKQDAGWADLRREGWTPEGLEKIKKVMEDEGILSVRIAANHVLAEMPPKQEIAMPGGTGGWNFTDAMANEQDADFKRLIETKGENEPLLRKMAGEAIAEVRGVTSARR